MKPKIRLMLGDCLKRLKDLEAESVDLVLSDPPYGTTDCKWDSVIPLEPLWVQLKRVAKPNAAFVFTASQPFTTVLISSNFEMFKYCWVWVKNHISNPCNAHKQPCRNHEDVVVFYKSAPTYNPQGVVQIPVERRPKRKPTNHNLPHFQVQKEYRQELTCFPKSVLRIKVERGFHPTQKPVALMEYLIRTYSNEGETVLDFAMGSGTTGVACKRTGRSFIGIELDKKYFNMAKERIKRAVRTHNKQRGLGLTEE